MMILSSSSMMHLTKPSTSRSRFFPTDRSRLRNFSNVNRIISFESFGCFAFSVSMHCRIRSSSFSSSSNRDFVVRVMIPDSMAFIRLSIALCVSFSCDSNAGTAAFSSSKSANTASAILFSVSLSFNIETSFFITRSSIQSLRTAFMSQPFLRFAEAHL